MAAIAAGAFVWVPDSESVWRPGRIQSITDGIAQITLHRDLQQLEDVAAGSNVDVAIDQLILIDNSTLSSFASTSDLAALRSINVPSMLHVLRLRYYKENIYTNAGTTLLSLNPYASLGLYSRTIIDTYHDDKSGALNPHIYGIAQSSYCRLIESGKNQSMIISGDSGSGKTETAKYALQYLTQVSMENATTLNEHSGEIENRVRECSPLLESFGNARTVRNDNSSRFGKYLQLFIRDTNGRIQGANISYFMLERSRIVRHWNGETNFHVFYTFLQSTLSPSEASSSDFGLTGVCSDYLILRAMGGSSDHAVASETNGHSWESIVHAMNHLLLDDNEQYSVQCILASILHLGNLQFELDNDQTRVVPSSGVHLEWLSKLTQIKPEILSNCLLGRLVGKEKIFVPGTPDQSNSSRNALCTELYSRLFKWLIAKINQILGPNLNQKDQMKTLGILDIFGFESFDTNGFEQVCINYCNERLQSMFIHRVLSVSEQDVYTAEGIDWSLINVPDGASTLNALNAILRTLDDECLVPGGSTASMIDKLTSQLKLTAEFRDDQRKKKLHFSIVHYAGVVQYNATEFIAKNKDRISDGLHDLLNESSDKFVASIIAANDFGDPEIEEEAPIEPKRGTRSLKKGKFLASHFRDQVGNLLTMLETTDPVFIRCIKPNHQMKPALFESKLVIEQLQNAGILELVRIRSAGYPVRMAMTDFLNRYGRSTVAASLMDTAKQRIMVTDIMSSCGADVTQRDETGLRLWQIGRTMVFMRTAQHQFLEQLRTSSIINSTALLQATLRAYSVNRRYAASMHAIHITQCAFHMLLRAHFFRAQFASIQILQSAFSSFVLKRNDRRRAEMERNVQQVQASQAEFEKVKNEMEAVITEKKATRSSVNDLLSMNGVITNVPSPTHPRTSIRLSTSNQKSPEGFTIPGLEVHELLGPKARLMVVAFSEAHIGQVMNHLIDQVLEIRYSGKYRIYNLCLDLEYDTSRFPPDSFRHLPFSGHSPCPFDMMVQFCTDLHHWLSLRSDNIAIIHSKAGKGRCSMMLSAYLLHCGIALTSNDAIDIFWNSYRDEERSVENGMTPSQKRYVQYYEHYNSVRSMNPSLSSLMELKSVQLDHVGYDCAPSDQELWLMIASRQPSGKMKQKWVRMLHRTNDVCEWSLRKPIVLLHDVKLEILAREQKGKMAKVLLYTCLHAAFLAEEMTFEKRSLDKVYKDEHHRRFNADLRLTLHMQSSTDGNVVRMPPFPKES